MTNTCPTDIDHPLTLSLPVARHRNGHDERVEDVVAEEVPVALVFNGISHAVMMASPIDLEEFATGFTLSEGIVARAAEIRDLEVLVHPDGIEIQMRIAEPAFLALKRHRRSLAGRTGCGVCGTESLALLDLQPEVVSPVAFTLAPDAIQRVLTELPAHQPLTRSTGCAHAAAWCSPQGEVLRAFEDVGRHNALDKLIGWHALKNMDTRSGFVFLTSRASYELLRKAARMNIATLATISAPTALAIRLAHAAGIRLLSFCRDNGFVEYPPA